MSHPNGVLGSVVWLARGGSVVATGGAGTRTMDPKGGGRRGSGGRRAAEPYHCGGGVNDCEGESFHSPRRKKLRHYESLTRGSATPATRVAIEMALVQNNSSKRCSSGAVGTGEAINAPQSLADRTHTQQRHERESAGAASQSVDGAQGLQRLRGVSGQVPGGGIPHPKRETRTPPWLWEQGGSMTCHRPPPPSGCTYRTSATQENDLGHCPILFLRENNATGDNFLQTG